MNASMVRMGGIAVFVFIGLTILTVVAAFSLGATVASILGIVATLLLLFVLWTTKGYFNALSYNRADLAILIVMAIYVIETVLSLVGGSSGGMSALAQAGATGIGVVAIIALLLRLVMFVAGIIFAMRCIDFAKSGGGIWKAIGILYLIASALFVLLLALILLGALLGSGIAAGIGGILGIVGGIVFIAGFVCHGIGLIMGAGKMSA